MHTPNTTIVNITSNPLKHPIRSKVIGGDRIRAIFVPVFWKISRIVYGMSAGHHEIAQPIHHLVISPQIRRDGLGFPSDERGDQINIHGGAIQRGRATTSQRVNRKRSGIASICRGRRPQQSRNLRRMERLTVPPCGKHMAPVLGKLCRERLKQVHKVPRNTYIRVMR